MSKTIDERVVSMQFDNRQFESNVNTTMSTLDKLKEKLKFDGATKGVDNLDKAVRSVNLSVLGNGVETVRAKFSALEVIGVTALANITNEAVNTGKTLLKSLSVDQVTSGWSKYEQKTASIQSIVNATGKSVDEVNGYLDKLMWFSDETSYSFNDMVSGLSTMVSSGGDINKLIPMLMGVANATAFAGKGAAEFSRILQYSVNQAYSMGYMQVQDWKTIEGATVNSKQLMETLILSAEELGKIDKGAVTIQNFRNSLKDGWLDKDVMERGFGVFAEMSEKAFEMVNSGEVDTASEAYELLSKKYDGVSITAAKAAQEAKTFTEAIDATKDAVSSGWMKSFELIFGNYEQAKVLWTDLANTLWDVFASGSEVRNWIIEGVMSFSKPWDAITEKLGTIKKVSDSVKSAADSLKYFQDVVDRVWMGEFNNWGDSPDRRDLLKAAGYDPRVVQELVNLGEEAWGSGKKYKLTIEEVEAAHKKFGLTMESSVETTEDLQKALDNLTVEQLKQAGLTEDEIDLCLALQKEADKAGISVEELAKKMSENDGRTMLIDSFKNVGSIILDMLDIIKSSFNDIFNPPSGGELIVKIYGIIESLKKFTDSLRLTQTVTNEAGEEVEELTEHAKKFKRIFNGVFAVIDVLLTVLGGPFRFIFNVVTEVLSILGYNLLDIAARAGDAAVSFRDWFKQTNGISEIIAKVVILVQKFVGMLLEIPAVKSAFDWLVKAFVYVKDNVLQVAGYISEFIDALVNLEDFTLENVFEEFKKFLGKFSGMTSKVKQIFSKITGYISDIFSNIINTCSPLYYNFREIAFNIVDGLIAGIKGEGPKLLTRVGNFISGIVDFVKEILGIHSPSKVFMEIGSNMFIGLINGIGSVFNDTIAVVTSIFTAIKNVVTFLLDDVLMTVIDVVKKIVDSIKDIIMNNEIDWGSILGAGMVVTIVTLISKVAEAISSITDPLRSFGDSLENINDTFKKVKKAFAKKLKADAFYTIAKSIAIIAGSIALLTLCDEDKLLLAAGVLAGVVILTGALFIVVNNLKKIQDVKDVVNYAAVNLLILAIGGSVLMMAIALKIIGDLNPNAYISGLGTVLVMTGVLVGIMYACGELLNSNNSANLDKIGPMLLKMSVALLILVAAMWIVTKLPSDQVLGALAVIAAIMGMLQITMVLSVVAGKNAELAGKMFESIGNSLISMAGAIGALSLISPDKIAIGIATIGALLTMMGIFGLFMAAFTQGTKTSKSNKDVLEDSGGKLTETRDEVEETTSTLVEMGTMFEKLGLAMLSIATSMTIIAGISNENIVKGLLTIGAILAMLTVVALLTKDSSIVKLGKDDKLANTGDTLKGMAEAVLILAGAVAALSLIKDYKSLAASVTAVCALLLSFALVAKHAGRMKGGIANIIILTVCIALLAGAMYALSMQDSGKLLSAAGALSAVMVSLGVVMASTKLVGDAKKSAASLLVMVGVVFAIGLVFAMINNLNGNMPFETVAGMCLMMGAMTGLLAIMSLIKIDVGTAFNAALALGAFIVTLGTIIAAIGAIALLPGVKELVEGGGQLLGAIGAAIGSLIGGFVSGIATGLLSGLPKIGELLSEFADKATGFFDLIGKLDGALLEKVGIFTAVMLALAGTGFINAVSTVLTFGLGGLSGFGNSLAWLANCLKNFVTTMEDFTPEEEAILTRACNVLTMFAEAAQKIPNTGGILAGIVGDNDMATFARQFKTLGDALNGFFTSSTGRVLNITDQNVQTAKRAAQVVTVLAKAAKEIPNSGGWLGDIVGNNDMDDFANKFADLRSGILNLFDEDFKLTDENVATAEKAGKIITALANASKEVPNTGGLLQDLIGEADLTNFANALPLLGTGLNEMFTNLGSLPENAEKDGNAAAGIIKAFAAVSESLERSGGVWGTIFGNQDWSKFAEKMPQVATGVKEFITNLGTISDEQKSAADRSVYIMNSLAHIAEKSEGVSFGALGWDLETFSTNYVAFMDNVKKHDGVSVRTAIDCLVALINAAINFANVGSDNLDSVGKALSDLANNGINAFVETLTGETAVTTLQNCISTFLTNFDTAVVEKYETISTTFQNAANAGHDAIKNADYYEKFKDVGRYFVTGFVNGIAANEYLAKNAGINLANKVETGIREGGRIQSPSRVTYGLGEYVVDGFVNALVDGQSSIFDAGVSIADYARKGLSGAISKVTDLFNGGMDMQPTIRPVLDLTDVSSGVNAMDSMLNANPSLGLLSSVGSINSSMNRMIQNGQNGDVISAINDLKNSLGNMSGDTYSINGITYSNGTEVADAVQTLVRAARIERRM